MDISDYIINTYWDSIVFGIDTFEITKPAEEVFRFIINNGKTGHYTVKVNPLSSKKKLHDYGFYYCDTLVEPYCHVKNFVELKNDNFSIYINFSANIEEMVTICHGAFRHGRFHRDFSLDKNLADIRYDLWLKDLHKNQCVFGLMDGDQVAGFFGFAHNKIVLHALSEDYRGKGLAKYFWSSACRELFRRGHKELFSSISVSNVRVINLYSSLGFRLRNPLDVYHLRIM